MKKPTTVSKTQRYSLFLAMCRTLGLPQPLIEFKFHPTRKFRADFAFLDHKLMVEVDGGLFVSGRHSRGASREKDMERDAEALKIGWRVLRVSPRHVYDGRAAQWVADILKQSKFYPSHTTP